MNSFQDVMNMSKVVEDYIHQKKGVTVKLNYGLIMLDSRQFSMLSWAYAHALKHGNNG